MPGDDDDIIIHHHNSVIRIPKDDPRHAAILATAQEGSAVEPEVPPADTATG